MNELVEIIQKIGIFMIAAQAVIHFAPGQKYEKYIKLIVSIMILIQFLSPIYKLLGNKEMDWIEYFANEEDKWTIDYLEQETGFVTEDSYTNYINEEKSKEKTVVKQMEEEVKTRLNNLIYRSEYKIANVSIELEEKKMENDKGVNESEYELDNIVVEVYRLEEADTMEKARNNQDKTVQDTGKINESDQKISTVDKIQIEKITVEEDENTSEQSQIVADAEKASQAGKESGQEIAGQFQKEFSDALGIREEDMEVIIYGTDEENDR